LQGSQLTQQSGDFHPKKEGDGIEDKSKRLLKYKSSDETFNYQSYIMKTNDQVPEISEIMVKKKQSDLMQNSNDNDTLKSLASYLRKGEFEATDKKNTRRKSSFMRVHNNDTLNLTLDNRSNEYLLEQNDPMDKFGFKEVNHDSDIEVSGLNSNNNSGRKLKEKTETNHGTDSKPHNNNFDQLMNNFDKELRVDAELDSINQKINNLKLRIQQHKTNLSNRNKAKVNTPLSNIRNFNNNLDDKNSDNSPTNYYKRSRPTSVVKNRENNLGYFLHTNKDVIPDSKNTDQGNKYTDRYDLKDSISQRNASYHKRSISYTPNTKALNNKAQITVEQQPVKNEYFNSASRHRNQSMGRSYSRSSSNKRRIKLESVGTSFFKDLVSKGTHKREYDNYYSN
jgi:hypothetical protein